jgi:hypothetical protein
MYGVGQPLRLFPQVAGAIDIRTCKYVFAVHPYIVPKKAAA